MRVALERERAAAAAAAARGGNFAAGASANWMSRKPRKGRESKGGGGQCVNGVTACMKVQSELDKV